MQPPPDTALAPPALDGNTPPHNLEAEQSVLGAMLLSERSLYALVIEEGLRPDDFYRERHRLIYAAMLELYQANTPIDVLTVSEHLRQSGRLEDAGGAETIDALTGGVPLVGNLRRYAQIVRENSLLRRLLNTTYQIQASVSERRHAPRDIVELAEKAMLDVARDDAHQDFRSIDDILHDELDKMQRLSAEGTALTGTPSGFKDLDEITGGFQPGNLIVVAARPAMGKCLSGSSLVYDPSTGARRAIADVVAAGEAGGELFVAATGRDLRLRPARVSAFLRSGVQPVVRLRTRLGRRIEATATHPVLTSRGWRPLGELGPGDRIAVPRSLPRIGAPVAMPDHEVVLLAALIAGGNLAGRAPRLRVGERMRREVEAAAAAMGAALRDDGRGDGSLSAGTGPNPLTELCERHGIWVCHAGDRAVPDAIFALPGEQIARFLGVLHGCGGHGHASERLGRAGYTTSSERLARDVQHLLLRLGIVAAIRVQGGPVHAGAGAVAHAVRITDREELRRFRELVPAVGRERRIERALERLERVPGRASPDTIAHASAQLVAASRDPATDTAVHSDVWWDAVASVEPLGEQETFDLTIPDAHNFVADDVIVHNSALVTNIAENAAIDHQRPVALFSLEMSEAELAQRFVASQGRIFGDKLRKGRVSDSEWPNILKATQRLSTAPLYVDDSSDIGILDIRAKARRLHQQAAGGLGLIIVDYLQLMRPDASTDNRVEQVGMMSRGLKILARELNVPVIALSQLSRAVEQRHDKKPILSDLRESGQIEQDADLVMFIYRDEYYAKEESEEQGLAQILIAKHRNGGLGEVTLTFRKEYPKFLNYAGERYQ